MKEFQLIRNGLNQYRMYNSAFAAERKKHSPAEKQLSDEEEDELLEGFSLTGIELLL